MDKKFLNLQSLVHAAKILKLAKIIADIGKED